MTEEKFKNLLLQLLKYDEEEHRKENTVYITQVLQCLRRSYYEIKHGIDPSYKLNKHILIGSAIHKYIEYLVNKYRDKLDMYIEVEKHVEFEYGKYKVVGRADIVTKDEVWEIKVVSKTYKLPSLLHITQANIYAYLLQKPVFRLVYIRDRNIDEFVYGVSDRLVDMFFNRLNTLIIYLEQNAEPPREEDFWCSTCPYKYRCIQKKLI